jgi:hypothetical protein
VVDQASTKVLRSLMMLFLPFLICYGSRVPTLMLSLSFKRAASNQLGNDMVVVVALIAEEEHLPAIVICKIGTTISFLRVRIRLSYWPTVLGTSTIFTDSRLTAPVSVSSSYNLNFEIVFVAHHYDDDHTYTQRITHAVVHAQS